MSAQVSMPLLEGKWYSVKEVSAILSCSVDHVRRLVKRGLMKALKLSVNSTKRKRTFVTLRIHSSEVERFIRGNMA
jgi:excisionase family DNA binding protein